MKETNQTLIQYFENALNVHFLYFMKDWMANNSIPGAVEMGKGAIEMRFKEMYPAIVWDYVLVDTFGPVGKITKIRVTSISLEGLTEKL